MSKLRLTGEWLTGFGFEPDNLLTAAIEDGSITFRLHDEGIEKYSALVKYARQNKMKLLQVKALPLRDKGLPYIELLGVCLDKAGFVTGDALLAFCEKGLIKLQRFDIADMGF